MYCHFNDRDRYLSKWEFRLPDGLDATLLKWSVAPIAAKSSPALLTWPDLLISASMQKWKAARFLASSLWDIRTGISRFNHIGLWPTICDNKDVNKVILLRKWKNESHHDYERLMWRQTLLVCGLVRMALWGRECRTWRRLLPALCWTQGRQWPGTRSTSPYRLFGHAGKLTITLYSHLIHYSISASFAASKNATKGKRKKI